MTSPLSRCPFKHTLGLEVAVDLEVAVELSTSAKSICALQQIFCRKLPSEMFSYCLAGFYVPIPGPVNFFAQLLNWLLLLNFESVFPIKCSHRLLRVESTISRFVQVSVACTALPSLLSILPVWQ